MEKTILPDGVVRYDFMDESGATCPDLVEGCVDKLILETSVSKIKKTILPDGVIRYDFGHELVTVCLDFMEVNGNLIVFKTPVATATYGVSRPHFKKDVKDMDEIEWCMKKMIANLPDHGKLMEEIRMRRMD